jgi:hypothetical protein
MKNFLTILLGIGCVTVLIFGHSYWNQRIATASNNAVKSTNKISPATEATTLNYDSNSELLDLTKNWPANSVKKFKETIKKNKEFKILFVGSPALGSDKEGFYPTVKEKLVETYGEKHLQVDIKTFDSTSTQFEKSDDVEELVSEKADIVIIEPFILLNNGLVLIEDTLKDITKIMDDIKTENPDTSFIIQPSYPLYKAKIYPSQVKDLKAYAKENEIPYLDHWSAWPNYKTKEITEYLQPDQSAPNEKGYQLWSESIIQYLISSKSESE